MPCYPEGDWAMPERQAEDQRRAEAKAEQRKSDIRNPHSPGNHNGEMEKPRNGKDVNGKWGNGNYTNWNYKTEEREGTETERSDR